MTEWKLENNNQPQNSEAEYENTYSAQIGSLTIIKKTRFKKPDKLSNKEYLLKFLLPVCFFSLSFLATLISCAILAPQILVAISVFTICITAIVCGICVMSKMSAVDLLLTSFCVGRGNTGEGCAMVIFNILVMCLILVLIAIAGIIAGLIGGIGLSIFLCVNNNNDKQRLGGLTTPLATCFLGIFAIPITICATNKKIWDNIVNFDLGKMTENVSKENKIIFGFLLAATFIALIGVSIYLFINKETIERDYKEVGTTELKVNEKNVDITKIPNYVLKDVKQNTDNNLRLQFVNKDGEGVSRNLNLTTNQIEEIANSLI